MPKDTLVTIANYLKIVGACDIAAANNIKNPNDIVEGMLLKIPTVAEGKQDNNSCISWERISHRLDRGRRLKFTFVYGRELYIMDLSN
jgi:hypothetical protein